MINNLANYSDSDQIYDILIVGAGPVGLSIAVGLQKSGINNFLVIDQAKEFRRVGQVVDLLPNGLKSIKYIEPLAYENIKKTALPLTSDTSKDENVNSKKWCSKDLEGNIIRETSLDFETWFNQYGEGRISVPWFELQKTLRDLLSSELIKINHRCISLQEKNEFIEITCCLDPQENSNPFAHWEMKKVIAESDSVSDQKTVKNDDFKKFKAKIVIGADGINSTVRQEIYDNTELEEWSKPKYSGWTAIGCFSINNVPDSIINELDHKYINNNRVITLHTRKSDSNDIASPRIILLHTQKNTMGYLLHAPIDSKLLQETSPSLVKQLAIDTLKQAEFPNSICELIALSSDENLIYRPYYIHPADIPVNSRSLWSQGRIVLVGDAAHGMPPFAAQGTNQGFEDAAITYTLITKIIKNNQLNNQDKITQEFAKYENIRRPFMKKIQTATMENYQWSTSQWQQYNSLVYKRDLEQLFNNL